jgi:hypothetical protein
VILSYETLEDELVAHPATASALKLFEGLGWEFFDASPGHYGACKRIDENLQQLECPTLTALLEAVGKLERLSV